MFFRHQVIERLDLLILQNRIIIRSLNRLGIQVEEQGERAMLDFTRLNTELMRNTSAESSVEKLLATLAAEIADLSTKISDPEDQKLIDDFAAKLAANTDATVKAVVTNTPAAAAAPPADTPPAEPPVADVPLPEKDGNEDGA